MNATQAIVLGIVQGLTEFLPVSSSGHLVVVQSLISNFSQPGVLFDVVLHLGTLVAVVVYFWRTLTQLSKEYLLLLIVGTIPVAIVGIFFQGVIEGLFGSTLIVGIALLFTATMNFYTDRSVARSKKMSKFDSLIVGIAQTFAIIPGISRSGSTIFMGTRLGMRKKEAAKFSFLLSVPAIFGANILQFFSYYQEDGVMWLEYTLGFIAAFLSGIVAIKLVFSLLENKKFKYFAIYCLVVGLLLISTSF